MSKVMAAVQRLFEKTCDRGLDGEYLAGKARPGEPSLRDDVQSLIPTFDLLVSCGDRMARLLETQIPPTHPDRAAILDLVRLWNEVLDRR